MVQQDGANYTVSEKKWVYGFDDVNEDDRLYWAVLVWTGLQLGCSGLHWTVFG